VSWGLSGDPARVLQEFEELSFYVQDSHRHIILYRILVQRERIARTTSKNKRVVKAVVKYVKSTR
jgi:predicted regulator of amino acid metabolism with ACT domain